jgi:threonine dehydratase
MPFQNLPFKLDLQQAQESVRGFVRRTPTMRVQELEEAGGPRVFLKLENLQVTGSFKVRGAANRMMALTEEERGRGVVTCSSGNHGKAVAYVAEAMDLPAVICVPSWVDPVKLEAMRASGARIVLAGATYDESEAKALALTEEEHRIFVQPFDDPWIAAGQGTLGLELLEDLPNLGTVLIPLSGGGLAGGMAYALKEANPRIRVVGVSASRARVMYESLKVGKPVTMPEEETLAEALAGGIGMTNRFSLALIRELVDEHVLVEEDEIARAMLYAWDSANILVEGGGAVALAALLGRRCDLGGEEGTESVAVVLSGGNVSLPRLQGLKDLASEPA